MLIYHYYSLHVMYNNFQNNKK